MSKRSNLGFPRSLSRSLVVTFAPMKTEDCPAVYFNQLFVGANLKPGDMLGRFGEENFVHFFLTSKEVAKKLFGLIE